MSRQIVAVWRKISMPRWVRKSDSLARSGGGAAFVHRHQVADRISLAQQQVGGAVESVGQ